MYSSVRGPHSASPEAPRVPACTSTLYVRLLLRPSHTIQEGEREGEEQRAREEDGGREGKTNNVWNVKDRKFKHCKFSCSFTASIPYIVGNLKII